MGGFVHRGGVSGRQAASKALSATAEQRLCGGAIYAGSPSSRPAWSVHPSVMAQVAAFARCLFGSKRRPRRCRSNTRPNLVCQPGPGPSWGLFSGAQGKTLSKPQPRPGAISLGPRPLGPVKQISTSYSALAQGEATVTRSNRSGFVYTPPYQALKYGFPYRGSPSSAIPEI